MKKIKLTIEGMHCAACAGNVEQEIGKISGVESVSVSVMTNKGIVECEDSVSEQDLKDAISRVGYKVIKVE
jgi:copper chaperone CopZ